MLDITLILDTPVEAVLDFKCCHLPGLNIEVLVRNRGCSPVTLCGPLRFTTPEGRPGHLDLYPFWTVTVAPGDVIAFYGSLEAERLRRCAEFALADSQGGWHAARIADPAMAPQVL
jgi:hypothetical protein